MVKNPRNRRSRDPKSVQKNALYFEPQLSPREAKKAKYVTFSTDFPEIRHTPKFVPKKIVTFQAAQRWQNRYLSASLRHHETPIKQARNRVWGNLDASWGPNSPNWRAKCDQIPLLQHIYIYIYACIWFLLSFSFTTGSATPGSTSSQEGRTRWMTAHHQITIRKQSQLVRIRLEECKEIPRGGCSDSLMHEQCWLWWFQDQLCVTPHDFKGGGCSLVMHLHRFGLLPGTHLWHVACAWLVLPLLKPHHCRFCSSCVFAFSDVERHNVTAQYEYKKLPTDKHDWDNSLGNALPTNYRKQFVWN